MLFVSPISDIEKLYDNPIGNLITIYKYVDRSRIGQQRTYKFQSRETEIESHADI